MSSQFLSLIFVLLSLLIVSECVQFPPPPNCLRFDCPKYSVVYSKDDFEIRTYETAVWAASPSNQGSSYRRAIYKGFRLLFDYFGGGNKEHLYISVTAPVFADIRNNSYQVNFYFPRKYQTRIPEPINDLIKLRNLPVLQYAAVRRFGGVPTDRDLSSVIALLKERLKGTPYERAAILNATTIAFYENPYRQATFRTNEVLLWFDKLI